MRIFKKIGVILLIFFVIFLSWHFFFRKIILIKYSDNKYSLSLRINSIFSPLLSEKRKKDNTSVIVEKARLQIGRTTTYDPSYLMIAYPMGDIPIEKGVCTDVVIRALRDAFNMDLQELIHKDMKNNFSEYPKIWGLKKTDTNIDHRRVPNIQVFFERMGYSRSLVNSKEYYQPGDIITVDIFGSPHIMIVSDKKTIMGIPYVIHNAGRGVKEEDILFYYPITGHFRIK